MICYNVSVKNNRSHKGGIIMTDNINKKIDNEELDLDQLENVSGGDGFYPQMSRECPNCGVKVRYTQNICPKCGYDFNNKTYGSRR